MHYKFIIDKYVCSFGSMLRMACQSQSSSKPEYKARPRTAHTHTQTHHLRYRSEINRTVENLRNVLDESSRHGRSQNYQRIVEINLCARVCVAWSKYGNWKFYSQLDTMLERGFRVRVCLNCGWPLTRKQLDYWAFAKLKCVHMHINATRSKKIAFRVIISCIIDLA